MMGYDAQKLFLGISLLAIFYLNGCLNDDNEVRQNQVLECLLSEYIEACEVQPSDTLALRYTKGWTDTSSVVSVREWHGGRYLKGATGIIESSFKDVTIYAVVDSINGTYDSKDGFTGLPIPNSLTWRESMLPTVEEGNEFSYPESFQELQVEFIEKNGFGAILMSTEQMNAINLQCNFSAQ